jgi:hypothetical protein
MVEGKLIHADETRIKLHDESAYVWVFATWREVVYFYSNTRLTPRLSGITRPISASQNPDLYLFKRRITLQLPSADGVANGLQSTLGSRTVAIWALSEHVSRRGASFSTNRQPYPRGPLSIWLPTTKAMTSLTRSGAPCTTRC